MRNVFLTVLLTGLLFIASCSGDNEPTVTTDEDLYINEVYSNGIGDDWIELYNASESAKDISGYFIYDDAANKYVIPNGTTLPAGGFLVLVCDDAGSGLHTNFKLSSDGETLYLENKKGELVDKVEFPALGNRQSYGRYPDGSDNFAISGTSSEGLSNGDGQAPAFAEVYRTPLVPGLDDQVLIEAEFVSTDGISSVTLFYRLNGGNFSEEAMAKNGNFFNATIPAANALGKVEYYLMAESNGGKTSVKPVDAPDDVYSYILNTDELPALYINEFMAANVSCCPDVGSGAEEFDDWIEIYNAGTEAVDLGGMYVSDNKDNPFNSKIPDDNPSLTTIQPGAFLVLWADGSKEQGPLHLDFKLDNAGEDIGLYYIDGRSIDVYTFGTQTGNISTGRIQDGGSTWTTFGTPTPGASNQ